MKFLITNVNSRESKFEHWLDVQITEKDKKYTITCSRFSGEIISWPALDERSLINTISKIFFTKNYIWVSDEDFVNKNDEALLSIASYQKYWTFDKKHKGFIRRMKLKNGSYIKV